MGLPQISIEFKSTAISAIQRGERGIVALILVDDGVPAGHYTAYGVSDIPEGLSDSNKEQVQFAFIGGVNPPKQVEIYVVQDSEDGVDLTDFYGYMEGVKFDYLAFPAYNGDMGIVDWIKTQRDTNDKKIKAVLPNVNANHEGIINFTTTNIEVGGKVYTAAQYCSRIAGLLAGTPLQISATYHVLPEVTNVPKLTKDQLDAKIDNGEFVIFHDGEKVKVARAVNSLTTTTAQKGEDWKKIKVVDILDLMYSDIKRTAEDKYIGKYANSYDNKVLLVSAINGYLRQLELDGLLEVGQNQVGIDVEKQRAYLQSMGVDVSGMSEQEIKEANTRDKVFLSGSISVLDAIENIELGIAI